MTYKTFYQLFGEALDSPSADLFTAERGWQDWMDTEMGGDSDAVADALQHIYHVAHMSVAEIRAATGLTQVKFAERFCIPRRTLENWESRNNCPDYIRLMMADVLGLASVERQ